MKKKFIGFVVALIMGTAAVAQATIITYDFSSLGGIRWQYDYSVTNDTLSSSIDEFTVYFAQGMYDNLLIGAAPSGWDPLVLQPGVVLGSPVDGFYDALATGSGIANGITVGLFTATFDWLGAGNPGSQAFDIVNPDDFSIFESGNTILAQTSGPAPVPEPGTIALLCSGLTGLFFARRRMSK